MELLIDTCTFLWICSGDKQLSVLSRKLFEDPANNVYLSSVSVWEIVIKYGLKKLSLAEAPQYLIPALRTKYRLNSLSLEEEATLYLERLPNLHRDPFDRMLICQANVHSLAILTPDPLINQYPVRTLW